MNYYFTCQKLSKFCKTCFTTTKEIALAPFNLAHPVHYTLDLSLYRFSDELQLNIENGASRTIALSACGRGTTLVTEPSMGSVLDLGPQFSQGVCRRTFLLRNSGRRHQSIVWSTDGFPLTSKSSSRRQTVIYEAKTGKAGNSRVDDTFITQRCFLFFLNIVLQKFTFIFARGNCC